MAEAGNHIPRKLKVGTSMAQVRRSRQGQPQNALCEAFGYVDDEEILVGYNCKNLLEEV